MTDHAESDVLGSAAHGQPHADPAGQQHGLLADLAEARTAATSEPGPLPHAAYHGRAVSWVAISTIIAGFICGGLALCAGPTWWAFWLGVGLAVAGGLLALATNIFEDWY
jgi:hypothetical protein